MAAPKGLLVKSKIENMNIGDCIPFRYTARTSGVIGGISELGTYTGTEIPFTGSFTPDGLAYFIKADKGLLICDRVVQHSISWDSLNCGGLIQGKNINEAVIPGTINANDYNGIHVSCSVPIRNSGASTTIEPYFIFQSNNDWAYTYPNDVLPIITIRFDVPQYVDILGFSASRYTGDDNCVSSFDFSASNDGTRWELLKTIQNSGAETKNCHIPNKTKYTFYKIEFKSKEKQFLMFKFSLMKNIGLMRSLSGGCAFMGANGLPKTTNAGLGAWPLNEWEKYIVKSDLNGKITPGDDDVWHWKSISSWCSDTAINNLQAIGTGDADSTCRTIRPRSTTTNIFLDANGISACNSVYGFRPVLQYVESKQKNIWY